MFHIDVSVDVSVSDAPLTTQQTLAHTASAGLRGSY